MVLKRNPFCLWGRFSLFPPAFIFSSHSSALLLRRVNVGKNWSGREVWKTGRESSAFGLLGRKFCREADIGVCFMHVAGGTKAGLPCGGATRPAGGAIQECIVECTRPGRDCAAASASGDPGVGT